MLSEETISLPGSDPPSELWQEECNIIKIHSDTFVFMHLLVECSHAYPER